MNKLVGERVVLVNSSALHHQLVARTMQQLENLSSVEAYVPCRTSRIGTYRKMYRLSRGQKLPET